MALVGLIVTVMVCFAANSVLARAGIDLFGMDPLVFAGVRVLSGAVILTVLVSLRGGWPALTRGRLQSSAVFLVYVVPFSVACLTLPSGVGTLILFGVVQATMFADSAIAHVAPSGRQWLGMGTAMAGLGWLLWPAHGVVLDPVGAALMALAGLGWGVFSLRGRGSVDPLGDMTWSFVALVPVAVVLVLAGTGWSASGIGLAMVSGAVTSGLGYALWYRVLPQIAAVTGAVAQLSVPVIAMCAGAVLLGEAVTAHILAASALVLGGIAVAVIKR